MSQSRKLSSFLKRMTVISSLLLVGLLTFSCGSDDSGESSDPNRKNIKLTLTVNGATSEDFVSFNAAGIAASNPQESTVWKVNGEVKPNENIISLDETSFTESTKTYVIESTTPLVSAQAGLNFATFDNRTYTFSYKAEVNGKVVKEESNVTVTADKNYTHIYTY